MSRTRLIVGAIAVAVAAAATIVALNAGAEEGVPDGTIPTLNDQYAAPPAKKKEEDEDSGSSEPAKPRTVSADPRWEVELPPDTDVHDFAATKHGYFLREDQQLSLLTKDGEKSWSYEAPEDIHSARVTDSVVIVAHRHPNDDRWPQPKVIVAMDAKTGDELWREQEASFWSATSNTIYLSVCYGGQNGKIGDCRFSARDPRNNAVRWSVATYASAQVINDGTGLQAEPTPPLLQVKSFPTGYESITKTVHDPATGAQLGREYDGNHDPILTENALVMIDDYDRNPANGCAGTLTGYEPRTGTQRWKRRVWLSKSDDGRDCGRLPESRIVSGRLGVTNKDGKPVVLNVVSGKVEWSAPKKGVALAATRDALLMAADDEVILYDVDSGKQRWRAPRSGTDQTSVHKNLILVGESIGYDRKTGDAWSYPGRTFQVADNWIATCDEDDTWCRGYSLQAEG